MTITLGLWCKLALTALMLGSIGGAFFGRRPRREHGRGFCRALALLAVACYAGAAVALVDRASTASAILLVTAIEGSCVAVWLARAGGEDSGGGGGDGGSEPEQPPPFDWDEFERAFRAYARERGRPRGGVSAR